MSLDLYRQVIEHSGNRGYLQIIRSTLRKLDSVCKYCMRCAASEMGEEMETFGANLCEIISNWPTLFLTAVPAEF